MREGRGGKEKRGERGGGNESDKRKGESWRKIEERKNVQYSYGVRKSL